MWSALSPERRGVLLAVLALGTLAVLAITVVLGRAQSEPTEVVQDDVGPVVLLSGYGGNVDALAPVVLTLQSQGRQVEVFPPVGDNTEDLREQAAQFERYATDLMAAEDATSIDVVGYSAGGLVARLWVREHDGAAHARRVVTLGSPHHGTGVSALATEAGGCPRACEQMWPGSDLLRRLNTGGETPPGPQWVTVRTQVDRTVTPPESAELHGALNISVQQLCPSATTSHGGLASSPATLAVLTEVLGTQPPQAPAADTVDCGS